MMTMVQAEDYPPLLRGAGLWFEELTDISVPTLRRTFVELSARLTGSAPSCPPTTAASWSTSSIRATSSMSRSSAICSSSRCAPMPEAPEPRSGVGDFYDRINDAMAEAMGGFLHGGYWRGRTTPAAWRRPASG
ncbi:hypothetical protein ACR6C2_29830 [Streptomyces sp. INA 01156]